jgi:hypothetical protein
MMFAKFAILRRSSAVPQSLVLRVVGSSSASWSQNKNLFNSAQFSVHNNEVFQLRATTRKVIPGKRWVNDTRFWDYEKAIN